MKTSFVLYCAVALSGSIQAVLHRFPIHEHYVPTPSFAQRFKREQVPFSYQDFNDDTHKIPFKDVAIVLYGIDATLGTPPQPFLMSIDIDWDVLFVPSIACASQFCNSRKLSRFDSSISSSFVQGQQQLTIEYASMMSHGAISNETLSFGGLQVERQPFLEATDIWADGYFHWYRGYSGVIGFQPRFDTEAVVPFSSPWQTIVESGTLDRNIFSIRLPNGPHDFLQPRTNGELVIGGVDTQYSDHNFTILPLTPTTPDSWSVEARSVIWGDGTSLRQDFDHCVATFSISIPAIRLPGAWSHRLYELIGAREHDGFFMTFPCQNREFLPNLTIVLGGNEMILTPYEYSLESVGQPGSGLSCMVGFDQSPDNTIQLGWPFLENFISVFDQDLREVRIAKSNQK
ncbi:acid protease [Mollisia scopiformis]|uniref:Acid protease n=1 Tax=Mollisia scopiformis TaxID=149040 RepID=A0A194WU27_MOLSC|nr:acid protease [Mollisia scopiformis]KUJ11184.1 acid protease [Mollisia scopiformis]